MTRLCGVFRTEERLKEALNIVEELQGRFTRARIMDRSKRFNTDLLAALETDHLLSFSRVIVASALARRESRGAHYRTDFVKRDDQQWLKHTMANRGPDGEPRLDYKPVAIDWDTHPPQERKY